MTLIYPSISAAVRHSAHTAKAPLTWDPSGHVQSRFAFGPTPRDRIYIARYGISRWFAAQVAAGRSHPGYSGHPAVAAQGPLLGLNPYDTRQWLRSQGDEYGWDAMDQLTTVTLGLQAFSSAQLYETLVDFFANHLNVPNHDGDVWNTRHDYDRTVVRANAMGSFTTMLLASSRHPAMLTYLSLGESTKEAVNENYGRELLELHTVGLRYSESDVKNAAALLTGRTTDDHQHYVFDDYIHPTGPVRVLGFTHANVEATQGEAAGDALLRYLAAHPYTATNLANKLCLRFVSDAPSAALVRAVAQSYLDSDTQILPMVRTILRSTEFWQSRGQKTRRPAENVIATLRTLQPKVTKWDDFLNTLHWITDSLGNVPLDWPVPNGYPDVAQAWRSSGTLLRLWEYQLGLSGGWYGGMGTVGSATMATLYGRTPATSGEAIDLQTERLTGVRFTAPHRAALQTFLAERASTPMSRSRLQWLGVPLVALILHGPHHALR